MIDELAIELTGSCPLACRHCPSCSEPSGQPSLPPDVVFRLVAEAVALGVRKVSFGGGEPTSSPLLIPALQNLGGKCLLEVYTCGAQTSGSLTLPLPYPLICALSATQGLELIFSMHGASPQSHDSLTRTPGSFVSMMASALTCHLEGIRCSGNFVPVRPNREELADVARLAEQLGMSSLNILRFVPQGRGEQNKQELALSPGEEDGLVEEILRLRGDGILPLRTGSHNVVPGNETPCRAGAGKMVVQPDGNILPCEAFKHREIRDWGLSAHDSSLAEAARILRDRCLRMGASGRCPAQQG